MGPWRGEVGFETLYWLPFLEFLKVKYQIPADRLIPVSRGGASVWYGTPTGLELFALRTPQQVRVKNRLAFQENRMLKQMDPEDPWDLAVLDDAAQKMKLGRYDVIHPSAMYRLYQEFWEARRGLDWFRERSQYVKIPAPPLPDSLTLPEHFLAVRFYSRSTFVGNDLTVPFVSEVLKQLSYKLPVIVLDTGLFVDDHFDFPVPKDLPNVIPLHTLMPIRPETNLAVMSAVIARSRGFVGTYGGVAQLAMRLGVGSISFYDKWHGTAWAHKHLSEVLSAAQGTSWVVERLMDLPIIQDVCPRMTIEPATKKSSSAAKVTA